MAGGTQHEYTELSDLSIPSSAGVARERFFDAPSNEELGLAATYQHSKGLTALLRDGAFRRQVSFIALYTLLWYLFSGMLSVYNKWLFGSSERDFPFPLFVSSIHMLVQYLLAILCLRISPNFQPSQSLTWRVYMMRAVPCGVTSALDVGLSNISLQTITLTFYTMCKSSTLGFVLFFSFLFGLEKIRLVLVAIIAVISLGIILMAAGEIDFVLVGFVEAISASAVGGLRWSLTQILLSQARFGMNNPIATMSKLTPIVGITMLFLSLVIESPFTNIPLNKNMATTHDAIFTVLVMGLGGMLAFAMVLSEYLLIQRTSVITLSIAGMLREVAMVVVAHLIFGDTLTFVNGCGLLVALFGIGMYNWLKIHDALHYASKQNGTGGYDGPEDEVEEAYRQSQAVLVASDPYDEIVNMDMRTNKTEDSVGSRSNGNGTTRRRQSLFPSDDSRYNNKTSTNATSMGRNITANGSAGSDEIEMDASLLSGMNDMALSSMYVSEGGTSPTRENGSPDPSKTK